MYIVAYHHYIIVYRRAVITLQPSLSDIYNATDNSARRKNVCRMIFV